MLHTLYENSYKRLKISHTICLSQIISAHLQASSTWYSTPKTSFQDHYRHHAPIFSPYSCRKYHAPSRLYYVCPWYQLSGQCQLQYQRLCIQHARRLSSRNRREQVLWQRGTVSNLLPVVQLITAFFLWPRRWSSEHQPYHKENPTEMPSYRLACEEAGTSIAGLTHTICAFLQKSGGAPGRSIKTLSRAIPDHGCAVCGSVPLFFPDDNNVDNGMLTFNAVSSPCGNKHGLC
jgi:hypothetical protein